MPDENPLAPKIPVIKPEIVSQGLSLIATPDWSWEKLIQKPPNPDQSDEGNDPFKEGRLARLRMTGGVPIAPAAATDYDISRRYNDPRLGFLPGRDNEDIYAKNQGIASSIGSGIARLVTLTGTKLGTGLGFLMGLAGIDNDSSKYGGKDPFASWIAGAGDNAIAKYFQEIEDNKIKNDWFPIYAKATEKNHGFFRHMGDLDFWTSDVTDGAAFMLSSFVPGMAISKLNIGAKVLQSLAGLREMGYIDEASALAKTGVEGTTESEALTKEGLGAQIEKPSVLNIVSTPTTIQEIPRVISWMDNAKAARSIDVGTTSVLNTASQAMFSANDSKNNAYNTLINKKNEDGTNKYTPDQAKTISAKVARDSYLMNLGALSLMNLWEANFIFKKASASSEISTKGINTSGLFGDAMLAKKTFGEKAADALKEPAKGFIVGGVWLGNMQLAIDRLNNNPDNFNLDFGDKMKALSLQYVNQLKDIISGKDTEAAKALGVGGLLASVAGKLLSSSEEARTKKSLVELNSQISAFKNLGNIYKTNEDGSLDLENGQPVLDQEKMKSWVASFNNILSLNQVARNFENRGVEQLAKIYHDEVFARFAKAHFDQGLGDLLVQKLDDVANIKPEDLALLGFDPDSKNAETTSRLNALKQKAKTLKTLYDNIENNYIPTGKININTKNGRQKAFEMKDKMFYLSARAASLNDRIIESQNAYDKVHNNIDAYNQNFNKLTDDVVNQYNERFEDLEGAKRAANLYKSHYDDELRYFNELNEGAENIPAYGQQSNTLSTEELINEKQKEFDKFVEDNKETLNKLKKDARGRYMYEVANKNILPSAKEMERQQIIGTELKLAHNATMQVLSRLADPKYGEKYYDEIYSQELKRHAVEKEIFKDQTEQDNENLNKEAQDFLGLSKQPARYYTQELGENEINDAYNKAIDDPSKLTNKTNLAEYLAEKIATGKDLTEKEEAIHKVLGKEVEDKLQERADKTGPSDLNDEIDDTTRKRDALEEKEDRTTEEETELQNLNKKVNALEKQRETAFYVRNNNRKIDNSGNIKSEDKPTYSAVLNQITATRGRVEKLDNSYIIDGKPYRKVTDLIGDTISDEQRNNPSTKAAVNAGNAIDTFVKEYFRNVVSPDSYNSLDKMKAFMGENMSPEAVESLHEQLDRIQKQLKNKGIDIVESNVYVIDDDLKVAGEIDLLGVDKNGNFKIYEIQARRPDIYKQYGKRGVGIKIRDIDSKRLNMYRNMFANQYGVIPDEIAVKFPVEVKYDKTNPQGFIEDTKVKNAIRFSPMRNVEIKMKNPEPLKLNSKFNSINMTKIFLDTFLTDKTDKDRLKFTLHNVKFDDIMKKIILTVNPAKELFQNKFEAQEKALNKEKVDFKIKKFRDYLNRDEYGQPKEFDNLYSLVGNTEIALNYEGQVLGYFSPLETLAYKDTDGNFKVLDENTDSKTYTEVTGNTPESYNEFKKVAAAYKKIHTELTQRMLRNPNKSLTLDASKMKELFDVKMSQGELDLIKRNQHRPDLKDLAISGVKVGGRTIPTIVNLDENDAVKVLMDKTKKNKSIISKYYDIDKWANQHVDDIKKAMTDQDGQRLTDNVGIIELPSGEYKIISLRTKGDFDPTKEDDFVEDLGTKFSASVNKEVFKNQGLMLVPKESEEPISLGLKDHKIVSKVYPTEDIETLEKYGQSDKISNYDETSKKIEDFFTKANDKMKQTFKENSIENVKDLQNDYIFSMWDNIDDYLDHLTNCK